MSLLLHDGILHRMLTLRTLSSVRGSSWPAVSMTVLLYDDLLARIAAVDHYLGTLGHEVVIQVHHTFCNLLELVTVSLMKPQADTTRSFVDKVARVFHIP